MDVIGRIAMGQNDSQMFKNPLLNFVKAVILVVPIAQPILYFQIFGDNRKHIPLIGGVFPSFAQLFRFFMLKLPFLGAANFIHVNNTMIAAVNNRIAQRENDAKNGMEIGEPQDFIDLFLDARADDVEHFGENNGDFSKSSSYVSRHFGFGKPTRL